MRCLIVDDNAGFAEAARRMLERGGIPVVGVASTSVEALHCIERLRPDVTLVDVYLGNENGFDLADLIHRSGVPTPVIMISTHAEQDLAEMIMGSPAIGFVAKYFLTSDVIRDLVRRHAYHDADPSGNGN